MQLDALRYLVENFPVQGTDEQERVDRATAALAALSSLRRERPKPLHEEDYEIDERVSRIVEGLDRIMKQESYERYWPADMQFLITQFESLRAAVGSLRREREEARKDSERIDWIQQFTANRRQWMWDPAFSMAYDPTAPTIEPPNVREVIDRARGVAQAKKESQ